MPTRGVVIDGSRRAGVDGRGGALVDAHLLDLGGTYGDPSAGDPIQYDELRIEHDQREVEIVVYDRAILLFTDDCEAVRRIHQVCAAAPGPRSGVGLSPARV